MKEEFAAIAACNYFGPYLTYFDKLAIRIGHSQS